MESVKNIVKPRYKHYSLLRTDNQLVLSDANKCNVFSNMLHNTFNVNPIINLNNDRRVLNY